MSELKSTPLYCWTVGCLAFRFHICRDNSNTHLMKMWGLYDITESILDTAWLLKMLNEYYIYYCRKCLQNIETLRKRSNSFTEILPVRDDQCFWLWGGLLYFSIFFFLSIPVLQKWDHTKIVQDFEFQQMCVLNFSTMGGSGYQDWFFFYCGLIGKFLCVAIHL